MIAPIYYYCDYGRWPCFNWFNCIFAFRSKRLLLASAVGYFFSSSFFKVFREIWCRRAISRMFGFSRYADRIWAFSLSLRCCLGYMTADLPQFLHRNCWLPALFLPFLTTFVLSHFGQWKDAVSIIIVFLYHHLALMHKGLIKRTWTCNFRDYARTRIKLSLRKAMALRKANCMMCKNSMASRYGANSKECLLVAKIMLESPKSWFSAFQRRNWSLNFQGSIEMPEGCTVAGVRRVFTGVSCPFLGFLPKNSSFTESHCRHLQRATAILEKTSIGPAAQSLIYPERTAI